MHGSIVLVVIGIAIALGVTGLWFYRRGTSPTKAGAGTKPKNQAHQWGVRIAATHKDRTCPQVRSFLGKEFPMEERPLLPLQNCPYRHRCECRYVPLLDRRKHQRRSGEERRLAQRYEQDKPPRRSGKDRRKLEIDWDQRK